MKRLYYFNIIYGNNDFAEVSKNLAKYRSEIILLDNKQIM